MCIHCLSHLYPPLHPLLTPSHHPPLTSGQNLFCPLVLQFCWRENVRDNKKGIAFLLVWDKDSYTEIPSVASMHMCITTHTGSSFISTRHLHYLTGTFWLL
jgi:hypothetical protein